MATEKKTKKSAPKRRKAPEREEKAVQAEGTKKPPMVARATLVTGTPYPKQSELSGWRLVDATNQTLGRLSAHIAHILMGKDKPGYTRFADTGDHVVVINAEKVVLTGKKWSDKLYHHHTNYPGGLKTTSAQQILDSHPERLIEKAVYGMLPKGHMGRRWVKKLRVFVGPNHPHTAQKPVPVVLPDLGPRSIA